MKWDTGDTNVYRWGYLGFYDVQVCHGPPLYGLAMCGHVVFVLLSPPFPGIVRCQSFHKLYKSVPLWLPSLRVVKNTTVSRPAPIPLTCVCGCTIQVVCEAVPTATAAPPPIATTNLYLPRHPSLRCLCSQRHQPRLPGCRRPTRPSNGGRGWLRCGSRGRCLHRPSRRLCFVTAGTHGSAASCQQAAIDTGAAGPLLMRGHGARPRDRQRADGAFLAGGGDWCRRCRRSWRRCWSRRWCWRWYVCWSVLRSNQPRPLLCARCCRAMSCDCIGNLSYLFRVLCLRQVARNWCWQGRAPLSPATLASPP